MNSYAGIGESNYLAIDVRNYPLSNGRPQACEAEDLDPTNPQEIGMNLEDDEMIRAVVRQWEMAWNASDMAAAAELFCDDADFVNVAGSHWHGREQIELEHARLHRSHLKGSVFAPLDVGVQGIGADTALVHIHRLMRGDRNPDGTPRQPRHGVLSWVMLRDLTGRWRIRSAHNTNTVTEK
jgi:uncharacterized protein (TIGR02246 family)